MSIDLTKAHPCPDCRQCLTNADKCQYCAERDQLRAEVERLRGDMAAICRITKGNQADLSKPVIRLPRMLRRSEAGSTPPPPAPKPLNPTSRCCAGRGKRSSTDGTRQSGRTKTRPLRLSTNFAPPSPPHQPGLAIR